jgi:NAD(P)-dependent dehydrogenase (short-subunit alcohol dehydrogenase family)
MSTKGVIVTGAASGVGLGLSKLLISKRWYVMMTDINPAGAVIASELGDPVLWVVLNIADWAGSVAPKAVSATSCDIKTLELVHC